ncbi:hypothetical protein TcCL_ESM11422 [Trypanosoma cruzi]|uniref:Uncharacterized protein n=1 Tax=Trypanosoma cruzi (strain CL Brener) TaxID=353153 RepID=Q4E299_TRYCC|nr:hypothetical protein Tc00.1047053511603.480 [Trypanosoma cruzi]EAN98924.1 hypothetical protein Tc00.1047053511603.480 [Trypanosoma cruzi]RNC51457.1 hypothetical protein TcCL_ESM11422 [Trypanosoma cruzi]|eukprot:XP_820775.1 hypothetical protein [Trypanosoma cruzi strain CL Brener]
MGTTTASPLEKVSRSVGCGVARRFACSPTDRTAQSFHCGHFLSITRCGGVRKSLSPDEDGLVVVWQPRTSGPLPFRIAPAARLAQHRPGIVLLQECRHQSAPATRLVGCTDLPPGLQWACRWRGLRGAPHLAVRAPVARGPNCLENTAFRVRPPASPSMHVVNLCSLPTAIAHAAHFASTIRRPGPAAPIAGDPNSHHELREGRSPSTTAGEDLAATPTGMECELSDDPAQATRISGRSVSFPNVTAQRVLRVSHLTSSRCMESDHHPPFHTAETEDGLPRQTGMLPRRKHAVVLREADCDASTSACATPLSTVITWLEMHRGTV